MKSRTLQQKKTNLQEISQSQGDCSCQLLDTSLSNVGDSDCSCSECLEANLQAFNQLKEMQENLARQNEGKMTRGFSTRAGSNNRTRGVTRDGTFNVQNTKNKLSNCKSVDRMRQTEPNKMHKQSVTFESQVEEYGQPIDSKFSKECINDYIKITQYRAREYLNQRKQLEKHQEIERNKLKALVKQNLQALKFTIEHKRNQDKENQGQQFDPRFRWNHQPYHCKSRVKCKKIIPFDPDLENKKQEIDEINKRIKEYQLKSKKEPYECPDRCPNHHLRTSKTKIAEIQKFIQEKAKKYEEKKKKEKKEKEQKQKLRAAKLRAIDIRCKNIVAKSKKYDPTISRTSFHNSIDHFSTFSQLRINKEEKVQEQDKKRKVKKAMKERGGMLEEQIYQNIPDSLIGDHPPIHSKLGAESRHEERFDEEQSQDWCEKIVKDAKIKPPQKVKKQDDFRKAEKKVEKSKGNANNQGAKNKKDVDKKLKKEEEKRRQLQMEIERRKEEIFNEYQKRNSGVRNQKEDHKNKKMRMEYEESIKTKKSPPSRQAGSRKQEQYDPYRQVYKNQPSKDPKHLKAVGDPLMHEYEYQKNVGKLKVMEVEQDHQIFTKSGTNLKSKQYLKV